ncbi:MAG: hypothetical protein VKP62_08315 [Candidatus Sericytochromatia bacterium]|nr:hypothetical protein [Candidatus Sericytochromatia bacterium]
MSSEWFSPVAAIASDHVQAWQGLAKALERVSVLPVETGRRLITGDATPPPDQVADTLRELAGLHSRQAQLEAERDGLQLLQARTEADRDAMQLLLARTEAERDGLQLLLARTEAERDAMQLARARAEAERDALQLALPRVEGECQALKHRLVHLQEDHALDLATWQTERARLEAQASLGGQLALDDQKRQVFAWIEATLLQLPVLRHALEGGQPIAAEEVLALLTPLQEGLATWGFALIGTVGHTVPFNPVLHQTPGEAPEAGAPVRVRQPGYSLDERLVRRALVVPVPA